MNSVSFCFLSILFLVSIDAKSQGHGFPFGSVTQSELAMTHYALDSSASAVVLNEFGEVYFNSEDGRMLVEIHKKIKILRKEGLDLADMGIELLRGERVDEKLISLEGITHYQENGKIRNSVIDKKSVFYEKNEEYYQVKFTMPNARVGSIFEIKYITSCFPRYNLYPWKFQSKIPKMKSEFWALVPANYHYKASLKGFLKLSFNESELVKSCYLDGQATADCSLLKFGMKNIPAFKSEAHMTAEKNYVSAINFELEQILTFDGRTLKYSKEWKDVEEELELSKDFGLQIKKANGLFKNEIATLSAGVKDPLEKAKKIYDLIKSQLILDETFYATKYALNGAKKTYELKKGSVGDLNLCLLSALQEAELNANPVILSTRVNGLSSSLYPVLTDFNYVVVHLLIGENSYLLDVTDDYLPFGMLPERCLNGKGRLIAKTMSKDIDLTPKGKEKSVTTLSLKLNDDGSLQGSLQINAIDYKALENRKHVMSLSSREEYIKSLEKKWNAKEIKNYQETNLQELEKPFIEKMDIIFEANDASNVNQIFFNPFIGGKWKNNPFKSTERIYPVDFGIAQEETILLTLEYPNTFHLDEIPKNVALTLPNKGGRFLFNFANVGNKMNVSYSLNLTKAIYNAEEYHFLKELISQIVQLGQTDLVFVRNK
jgi:hypothetical protein